MTEIGAKSTVTWEMSAVVRSADGREADLGTFGTRRFWFAAFRWNLSQRHWRVAAANLRAFPRYMMGRG